MLVNCPKCGFSQPKDKYCANCGVDMDVYRPRETPFWKKVLGSPLLHVAIIFAVVLASILFIRQRQQDDLRARVEYLKGGPVVVDRQDETQVEVSASQQAESEIARDMSSSPTEALPAPAAPPPPAEPSPANPTAIPPEVSVKSTGNLAARTAEVKTAHPKAVIIYVEIDSAILDQWTEEMRAAGQIRNFDGVLMGVLPQASQKLKSSRGVRILQKVEHQFQNPPSNHEWFLGTHKTPELENEMGFFHSLALIDSTNGLIKGELEVQRAFRDLKDPMKTLERVSFGSPFELVSGAAYIMRGLLPRKFVTDLTDDFNPDPYLSIFNSRSFANGQTEFALILEFETSSAQGR